MADFQSFPVITDAGRLALSSLIDAGTPLFQITHFAVGTGGYSPTNPFVAIPPDPASTSLQNEIFRTNNVARENLDMYTRVYVGKLAPGQATGILGEYGLYATYLTGPNKGSLFLFALTHSPAKSKTPDDSFEYRLPVMV